MALDEDRGQSVFGPFQNPFQTFFGGLDRAAVNFNPLVRNVARANLEAMGLWSRRVQAYWEIPSRLANCRTMQDVTSEQMRFWQTATAHYQESGQKIAGLWLQAFAQSPLAAAAANTRRERDFITFPEPAEPSRADVGSPRRAA